MSLLDELNPSKVTTSAEPAATTTLIGDDSPNIGADLTTAAAGTGTPSSAVSDNTTAPVADDRDKASLFDEIQQLRAENKARRLQLSEEKSKLQLEFEQKLSKYDAQMKTALSAKEELEALKAKDADKKRSIEEKLAHREATVAELEANSRAIEERYQAQLLEREQELVELRTAQEAQKQVYQERIDEEMKSIPESRRKFAQMMLKGHSDPREAWASLSEAKADGLFEDKTTVVSHATPGVDSSRMTQERMEDARREQAGGMTSSQKIKQGLKQMGISKNGKIL